MDVLAGAGTVKLTRPEMNLILKYVFGTEDDELACGDALDGFAALAEEELRGGAVSVRTVHIAAHIHDCPECAEEYASLLLAIEAAATRASSHR